MAAITTILKLAHAITCIIPVYVDGGLPEWILESGFWVDINAWDDTAVWID